jgi:prepilin-type processing-associated H-X9-DG protein
MRMVFLPAPVLFHCPSRRVAMPYKVEAHHPTFAKNASPNPAGATDYSVGAADYAANAGDGIYIDAQGPATWQEGQNQVGFWFNYVDNIGLQTKPNGEKVWQLTGIMFQRSEVGVKHITDGASKTYLLGERYLDAANYNRDKSTPEGDSTVDGGDEWGWAWGFCDDNTRSGFKPPAQDYPNYRNKEIFGSAHPGGFHMAFCDGHVESLSYDIDLLVHQNNANRRDDGDTTLRKSP